MAIMVKLECLKCGEIFDFNPAHYSLLGLKDIPKVCPKCADIRQGNKLNKIVVKRELLNEWKGVYIEKRFFKKGRDDDRDKYVCKIYGGRRFGVWGGARFEQKYLFFINKQIAGFPAIVDIRKMKKLWQGVDGSKGENIYFVIDPSSEVEKQWYLYEIRSWYKKTLRGLGRNRDYTEHLEAIDEEVEITSDVLCEVSSCSNSGRFGNNYKLILTDAPCMVVGEGVA